MPENTSPSPSDLSWQQTVFAELRAADDWLRAGDIFSDVEAAIPLHHAMRYCSRARSTETSPNGARWKYFVYAINQIGIAWERKGYRRLPSDRLRLKEIGKCASCGGALVKAGWTNKTTAQCKGCGTTTDMPEAEKVSPMKKSPLELAVSEPARPHPLIGYRVTKRDGRGAVDIRNGTIIEVVSTNNLQFGDIAVIAYRNGLRVDFVSLAELSTQREVWQLMRPGSDLVEAAD